MKKLLFVSGFLLFFASTVIAVEFDIQAPSYLNIRVAKFYENDGATSDPELYPYLCTLTIRNIGLRDIRWLTIDYFLHDKNGNFIRDGVKYVGEIESYESKNITLTIPAFGYGGYRYPEDSFKIKIMVDGVKFD